MAKPVAVIPTAGEIPSCKDVREELLRKVQEAPVEHAAAILDSYELLQVAHDRGTLDLLRGLFGAGDDIVGRISAGLSSQEAIRGLRNIIVLAKISASIDPEFLHGVSAGLSEAAERNRKSKTAKPPTLWSIFRQFRSEDSRRALAFAADALESVGKRLDGSSSQNSD